MNWIKYPLLPISLGGLVIGLLIMEGCEHGACTKDYTCTGGEKFTSCKSQKFVCDDVEGCKY